MTCATSPRYFAHDLTAPQHIVLSSVAGCPGTPAPPGPGSSNSGLGGAVVLGMFACTSHCTEPPLIHCSFFGGLFLYFVLGAVYMKARVMSAAAWRSHRGAGAAPGDRHGPGHQQDLLVRAAGLRQGGVPLHVVQDHAQRLPEAVIETFWRSAEFPPRHNRRARSARCTASRADPSPGHARCSACRSGGRDCAAGGGRRHHPVRHAAGRTDLLVQRHHVQHLKHAAVHQPVCIQCCSLYCDFWPAAGNHVRGTVCDTRAGSSRTRTRSASICISCRSSTAAWRSPRRTTGKHAVFQRPDTWFARGERSAIL